MCSSVAGGQPSVEDGAPIGVPTVIVNPQCPPLSSRPETKVSTNKTKHTSIELEVLGHQGGDRAPETTIYYGTSIQHAGSHQFSRELVPEERRPSTIPEEVDPTNHLIQSPATNNTRRRQLWYRRHKAVAPERSAGPMANDGEACGASWMGAYVRTEERRDRRLAVKGWFATFGLLPITIVAIVLWLFSATLFFVFNAKFNAAESFYFAVQSGMSIGFGVNGVMVNDAYDPVAARW